MDKGCWFIEGEGIGMGLRGNGGWMGEGIMGNGRGGDDMEWVG